MAAYPVSYWYAENADEVFFFDVMALLAIIITSMVVVTLLLRLFVRDNVQVAIIVSIILVIFFLIVPLHRILGFGGDNPVNIAGIAIGRYRYLMPFSAAIGLVGVTAMIRSRWNLTILVNIATCTALVLLLFNAGRVVLENRGGQGEISFDGQSLKEFPLPQVNIDQLPDIYYIVPDSYGRADVLQESFDYDNTEFINSLTRKGFFVATESLSNYPHTVLSLGSSLSMRYLKRGEEGEPLISENAVAQMLQRVGYQYVHISSGSYLTDSNRHSDLEYRDRKPRSLVLNEFSRVLFSKTALYPLAIFTVYDYNELFTPSYTNDFNHAMSVLRDIPDIHSPTFTFSHLHPPHPPFIFDRDGNMPDNPGTYNSPLEGLDFDVKYIDSIDYINGRIDSVVDDILNSSPSEPIIIIQADHGPPHFTEIHGARAKMAILNAYYLPEYCRSELYPSISPVNSFRTVFNSCLGTNFELLPDESYWDTDEPPIDFTQDQR